MSTTNPIDQINKASWALVESVKDAIVTNLAMVVRQANLDVKPEALAQMLSIVNSSVDQGFHKGNQAFLRAVNDALADHLRVDAEATKKKRP